MAKRRSWSPVRVAGALTASSVAVRDNPDEPARTSQGSKWQRDAWAYFRDPYGGELSYSAGFVGNCFSRVILTLGVRGKDGKVGPVFDEDGLVLADVQERYNVTQADADKGLSLITQLRSKIGGQAQLLSTVGLNMSVTGEGYLVGFAKDGATGDDATTADQWEFLSVLEWTPKPNPSDGFVRVWQEGGRKKEYPATTPSYRIWEPDPAYSRDAWSSVRPLLGILEELKLLTLEVRSNAVSRLNNGILVAGESMFGSGSTEDVQGFVNDLILTVTAAKEDPGSAAGPVPYVWSVPDDAAEKKLAYKLDLAKPESDSIAKRKEAIHRFAQGVDLPVEVVEGHMNTTFANAAQIDDATYKAHLEPKFGKFVDALTVGYLEAAMAQPSVQLGHMVGRFVVWYDASELVSQPDMSGNVVEAYDKLEASGSALRRHLGLAEGDRPDDDEIEERLRRIRIQNTRETVRAQDPTAPPDPSASLPTTELPPGPQAEAIAAASTRPDPRIRLADAGEPIVARAVQHAGARLRSKVSRTPTLAALVAGAPDERVAAILGPEVVAGLVDDVDGLMAGAFGTYRDWAVERFTPAVADFAVQVARDRALARLWNPDLGSLVPEDFDEGRGHAAA